MRILFLAAFGACRKQTVPRRLLPLAVELAGMGHVVEVLIPAWDCPQEAGRVESWRGVTLRFPRLGPAPHPLLDLPLLWRLWRAVDDFAPDVVHVSKGLGYAGLAGLRNQRRGQAKLVVDVDDLESVEGWGAHRQAGLAWLAVQQERRLLRRAHGATVAAIALCPHITSGRTRPASPCHNHCCYLPNGLYPAPSPAPVATNPPIVLLYTRGNDVRPAPVAKVWDIILQRCPSAQLRIIGDWRQAPDLPQCQRLGWLDGDELTAALRQSAVAMFPVEDSPLVAAKSPARLLDCLAQGLPVVTAAVGEYALLVGDAGVCVRPGQAPELAEAVVSLLTEPERRAQAGRASWEQGRQHDWRRRAETLAAFYGALGTT